MDDFFLYDEVLETALMLGILPTADVDARRATRSASLTALARGTPEREAWEMTKWFDTNYHFVVPEIDGPVERVPPLPWREPTGEPDVDVGRSSGPYSLARLSKLAAGIDADRARAAAGAVAVGLGARPQAAATPASASSSTSRASGWR